MRRLLLAVLVCLSSCGRTDLQKNKKIEFQLPEIPVSMTDVDQRTVYLVSHYWDRFDFKDTLYIGNAEVTEQAFVNYLDLLNRVDASIADSSLRDLLDRAAVDTAMYSYLTKLSDRYLYDPNSPMRNEERYIPVLENRIASDCLTEVQKVRLRYRLALAKKNRPGMVATDFIYTLASGKTGRLHEIETPYTILYVNNPGCKACSEITDQIGSSTMIDQLLQNKQLAILALYPDEELEEWRKHAADIPKTWINAYDRGGVISRENLYDLKAIPTLYLLDREKRVLLKDATFNEISNYLFSR